MPARHAAPDRDDEQTKPAEPPTPCPVRAAEPRCRVPGCDATPEWRGLCPAHRQTHRGLAEPKAVRYRPEPIHTRESRIDPDEVTR